MQQYGSWEQIWPAQGSQLELRIGPTEQIGWPQEPPLLPWQVPVESQV